MTVNTNNVRYAAQNMKNPMFKLTGALVFGMLIATVVIPSFILTTFTGCKYLSSVTPAVTNDNGNIGGSIQIVFKDRTGSERSLTMPEIKAGRGYTTGGDYLTIGQVRGMAADTFNRGETASQAQRRYKLSDFDRETIEIVVLRLWLSGAIVGTAH